MTGTGPLGAILTAAALAAGAALAGGFLGALHPAGDSLAVFRPHLAAALGVLCLMLLASGWRRAALGAGAMALAAGLALLPHHRPASSPGGADLALYQKNLRFGLDDSAPLLADILAEEPDILTLQEVSDSTRAVVDALAGAFPTRVVCPFSSVGGPAVLSRFPALAGSARCLDGAAVVTLDTPCGPVRVVSIHLHWPWPYQQGPQVAKLSRALGGGGPTLAAGDFNMVQWSHALRTLARATGTVPVNTSRITLPDKIFGLGLPIDHVLAPARAGAVAIRPRFGSDHRGLVARMPCRAVTPP